MGMFDSIYIDIKCPFCGQISEIECQTKELDCNLSVWRKCEYIGTNKYNYLDCIADCHSGECMEFHSKRIGYKSGFGRMFNVKILIDKGIVTGEYEII